MKKALEKYGGMLKSEQEGDAFTVSIMISIDILFDFLCTAYDAAFLQLAMIRVADKTQMLNYETLRKPADKK